MKRAAKKRIPSMMGWAALLFSLILLSSPSITGADNTPEDAEKTFPGLTEVLPKASALAAKATEANTILGEKDPVSESYVRLGELENQISTLEAEFTDWEKADTWPLNRLMTAAARYNEIKRQQQEYFEALSGRLSELEALREKWNEEQDYWRDWQTFLGKEAVTIPKETFTKTQQGIDELIDKISTATSQLVKNQEKFSVSQEILVSRLALIDKTLNELRKETFRRNAYSLFNREFYQQLTPGLFVQYRDNIESTLQLPEGFWQRHGWVVGLQLVVGFILAILLLLRKNQTRPISEDWRFLFKHPLAGSIFTTLAATSSLYENIPPSWGGLILTIATISGTILVGSMAENQRRKRLIRVIAFVFLFSEALKITGIPDPAYQFYIVILCALSAPACLLLAGHRKRQQPDTFGIYLASLYMISLFAIIGLVTALLGFLTLSTHLVDAVLGTMVVVFMVRIAIHLVDGGITEFMRNNWVRGRQLTMRLGISTADRLKTLAHIVILVNAGLFLLVMWGVYNDVDEATTSLLSLEYTIGEFSISVFMLVMLALVLYLTSLTSWLLQGLVDAHYMTPRKMDFGVKNAIKKLLHYALFTIGFFIAVSMAGLELQKLTIIAGALSVGIGFGLQNIVNNFVSGLILLFERPVKEGDTINIDDQWGTITKIGLRSTVFETLDRSEIIVPNSELVSQKVVNWTFTTNVSRVVLTVGVAYGSPLEKVLEILQRVAKEHPDVLEDPQSSAIFTGFGDSSIDFELRAWISDISKRLKVKSELGQAVDRYFREESITIPFPQRDLHLRSIDTGIQPILEIKKDNN